MRKHLGRIFISAAFLFSAAGVSTSVMAEDVKMVGVVTKLKIESDGKSAQATLKDNKTGNPVTLSVTDDLTLDKFKDKRIQEGDEIRARYDNAGGKNESKSFKKTAGC